MIFHVLLFRVRSDVPIPEQHALVDAYAVALQQIPSIRRASVGTRTLLGREYEHEMREDYPYAAILEFEDVAAVHAYIDHPAHAEIATRFFAITETRLVYDFDLVEDITALRRMLD